MFFTAHAVQRMWQRGITVEWVIWALQNGVPQQAQGNRFRVDVVYNQFGNRITVILDPTLTIVITTYWS